MSLLYRLYCLIYPERCPYCEDIIRSGGIACDKCMEKLDELQEPIIRGAMGYRCVSSFIYGGSVRGMILRIKYRQRIQYLAQAAVILARDIRAVYGNYEFDYISYVPMHPIDRKKRKYNQAQLLAEELSKALELPCIGTLNKVKHTQKQQRLTYVKRKKNLVGAFKVIDRETIRGKSILLIDDIITTGITLGTCCQTLNRSKPRLICCATIANANHRLSDAAII